MCSLLGLKGEWQGERATDGSQGNTMQTKKGVFHEDTLSILDMCEY